MIKQVIKADYQDDLDKLIYRAEAEGWAKNGVLKYQTSFNGGYFLQEMAMSGAVVTSEESE